MRRRARRWRRHRLSPARRVESVQIYAVLTGLVVVGSTLLAESASHLFDSLRTGIPGGCWLALQWTPLLTVAIVCFTREHVPVAAGSGIPQVMRALNDDLAESDRNRPVWLRLAFHKVVLVAGGMLAGLSIGREGPMVQVCRPPDHGLHHRDGNGLWPCHGAEPDGRVGGRW